MDRSLRSNFPIRVLIGWGRRLRYSGCSRLHVGGWLRMIDDDDPFFV